LKGLLKEESWQDLRNQLANLNEKIANLSTIIQSIDNPKKKFG